MAVMCREKRAAQDPVGQALRLSKSLFLKNEHYEEKQLNTEPLPGSNFLVLDYLLLVLAIFDV